MTASLSSTLKRIKANKDKIMTPIIDKWLVDHPEGIVVPPELMYIVEYLLSAPNADRSARFGASGRGRCLRRQVFDFMGMPGLRVHDPVQQNLFNDGTWRHIRWQLMGLLSGALTHVECSHELPQYHLKVSCDGEHVDQGYGFELKGMSWMQKLLNEGISDYHMGQVHTYFLATGYDRFVYIAEDKRTQSWMEFVVRQDPIWMKTVKGELNALSDAVEDQQLPPVLKACKASKGDDFHQCPYSTTCPAQGQWPVNNKWT